MLVHENKDRRSPRAQWWDYTRNAAYFVTICTNDRIHYFGEIENGAMHLSPVGKLAEQCWFEIVNHARNVTLGAFIVMPNHVHGILIINNSGGNTGIGIGIDRSVDSASTVFDTSVSSPLVQSIPDPVFPNPNPEPVGTRHALSLPYSNTDSNTYPITIPGSEFMPTIPIPEFHPSTISPGKQRFQNPGKNSLSSIIGSYKSAVTKHAHLLHLEFGWQHRFYDHIIRNNYSFYFIERYIYNNVKNWDADRFYIKGQSDQ